MLSEGNISKINFETKFMLLLKIKVQCKWNYMGFLRRILSELEHLYLKENRPKIYFGDGSFTKK